jgi:hypothetical protein
MFQVALIRNSYFSSCNLILFWVIFDELTDMWYKYFWNNKCFYLTQTRFSLNWYKKFQQQLYEFWNVYRFLFKIILKYQDFASTNTSRRRGLVG